MLSKVIWQCMCVQYKTEYKHYSAKNNKNHPGIIILQNNTKNQCAHSLAKMTETVTRKP